MHAADLGPIPVEQRNQPASDLFLIFAGANIVATTLQTGATLAAAYGQDVALALILVGVTVGSALVAVLAPLGPRLGVPSIIAARAALGVRGAGLVAGILFLTNFAWIAINNVIAASVLARSTGSPESQRLWAAALGVLATVIVARGPAAVRLADRIAVPLMLAVGVVLTWTLWRQPRPSGHMAVSLTLWRGFDVVVAYQVSWLLMFADYSRYTQSPSRAAVAVFLGLFVTSLWLMPLGFIAATAAGSLDPGVMLEAAGLGGLGAILLALATVTTNFVNIYMSALAWKSLVPTAADQLSVWSIGLIGTLLGLFSTAWLERYADFMILLGSVLLPVGGVLIAHYVVLRSHTRVQELYDARGTRGGSFGFRIPGIIAWAAGSFTYFAASSVGSSLPAIACAVVTYLLAQRLVGMRSAPLQSGSARFREQGPIP